MTMFKRILSAAIVTTISMTRAMAGKGVRPIELIPEHGQSFDVGNQRAVSYFLSRDGICKLTLMLADHYKDDEVVPGAATRMTIDVVPGRQARIDAANGRSLGFDCQDDAARMSISEVQQIAWTQRK